MRTPIIQLSEITKDYILDEITTKVLHGISVTINKGDFIAITGPSGSGKSTLLNIIGLLDNASFGKYILNGKDVTQLTEDEQARVRNKEIGFVFQAFNLLKRSSVLDNVILPSIYKGMKKSEREVRATDLLNKVGLSEQIYKKPNQLSGGQQQRVAIARALMNNPSIILADEPTGNLDTKSGNEIMEILKDLNKKGNTIIIITHEHDIAAQTKRIIQIKDGKVV
jgi:putative ABC transport system ATP-binding protein